MSNARSFNTLQNNKILDRSKLKASGDDKINVAEIKISLSNKVKNIVGKGENAAAILSKSLFFSVIESQECVVKSEATFTTLSAIAFNFVVSYLVIW